MGNSIINTFMNALTPKGLEDLMSNGFGVTAPLPDTAAFILGPDTLLTGGLLGSYVYNDLQIDEASEVSMAGLFTVTPPDQTGLVVVSWTVSLNVSTGTTPLGIALYASSGPDLWVIAAFDPNVPLTDSSYQWNGQVALGQLMCSS